MKWKQALLLAGTALLQIACEEGTSSNPGPISGEYFRIYGGSVLLEPGRIIRVYDARMQTWCLGSELQSDSVGPVTHTEEYLLEGGILTIFHEPGTLWSGAIFQEGRKYHRLSGSVGLEGVWEDAGPTHRMVSGILSEEEKGELDRRVAIWKEHSRFRMVGVEFRSGKFHILEYYRRLGEAFLEDWNRDPEPGEMAPRPNRKTHNIEVRLIDENTVELIGGKTGETIKISYNPRGWRTVSSDHPLHAGFTSGDIVQSCPYPGAWLDEYYRANVL